MEIQPQQTLQELKNFITNASGSFSTSVTIETEVLPYNLVGSFIDRNSNIDLLTDAVWTSGILLSSTGTEEVQANSSTCDYIEIDDNVTSITMTYASSYNAVCYYDFNYAFLGRKLYFTGGNTDYIKTVLSGTKYIRCSLTTASLSSYLLVATRKVLKSSFLNLPYYIVDANGNGDFETIQEAVNLIPVNNTISVTIYIKSGIYEEDVQCNLKNINFIGEDVKKQLLKINMECGKNQY